MGQVHNINKKQAQILADKINDPNIGGFTIKGSGDAPLAGPSTPGFLAGGIVGEDNLSYPINPESISDFHQRSDVQDALAPSNHFLGGWHSRANEGKPDTSSLDVSEFHGYDPSDHVSHNVALAGAYVQGIDRKQEAIGSYAQGADGSVNYDDDIYIDHPPAYGSRDLAGMLGALRTSTFTKNLRRPE